MWNVELETARRARERQMRRRSYTYKTFNLATVSTAVHHTLTALQRKTCNEFLLHFHSITFHYFIYATTTMRWQHTYRMHSERKTLFGVATTINCIVIFARTTTIACRTAKSFVVLRERIYIEKVISKG